MTPSPAQDQNIAPPPVMTSNQIMQHVDSVYQGLPDPVKQALDHAHALTGGSPGSSVKDATTVPPPAPMVPHMIGVHADAPTTAPDTASAPSVTSARATAR